MCSIGQSGLIADTCLSPILWVLTLEVTLSALHAGFGKVLPANEVMEQLAMPA